MAAAVEQLECRVPLVSWSGRGTTVKELIERLWQDERGDNLSEYALLIVLASLVMIAAIMRS